MKYDQGAVPKVLDRCCQIATDHTFSSGLCNFVIFCSQHVLIKNEDMGVYCPMRQKI